MSTQHTGSEKTTPKVVTTATGRILRVNPDGTLGSSSQEGPASAQTAAAARTGIAQDPARRADVLFRVRREAGHELSVWWMVGAFVVTSGLVIALLSWVPGGA
ncbi:hypothetical protein ACI7YT_05535 [Microbacterium sp. M]|uniref:hypothetical protein n=1 Tax=Microbacterium sp. M TaxID=3377125 RepID=UPI0038708055